MTGVVVRVGVLVCFAIEVVFNGRKPEDIVGMLALNNSAQDVLFMLFF